MIEFFHLYTIETLKRVPNNTVVWLETPSVLIFWSIIYFRKQHGRTINLETF